MKILIINLKSSVDRKQNIEQQLKRLNITNYEFIDAVNGNNLDQSIIDQKTSKRILFNLLKRTRPLLKTEAGCTLSHIKAYKRSLEIGKRCIILEDDVILTDTFKETENMKLDDKYNLVYLGYILKQDDFGGDRVLETYHEQLDNFYRPVTTNIIYDNFFKLEFKHIVVYGTHAYSPSLSMCKKLIDIKKVIAPSDILLHICKTNVYCPLQIYAYTNRKIKSTIGDRSE
jgi:GR25 family glycosyltransferase involved in LPS biosynthesis